MMDCKDLLFTTAEYDTIQQDLKQLYAATYIVQIQNISRSQKHSRSQKQAQVTVYDKKLRINTAEHERIHKELQAMMGNKKLRTNFAQLDTIQTNLVEIESYKQPLFNTKLHVDTMNKSS